MLRYSRKWNEARLLAILAYRPFITVSHFDHADKAKRLCVFAAKKRGLVVLEDGGAGYFTVRLAKQPATAYARRKYGQTITAKPGQPIRVQAETPYRC